jgi:hypothetical protein
MKESQIREHIKKGWIRAIVTFEVVGRPKEHVEKALTDYLDNIKKDHRIIFLREEREAAMEHDDGMFSAFCEAEMLAENLEVFTWLCINFGPASIEILEPDKLLIEGREVTNWLNDLLAKLHEVGTATRETKSANDHITGAMNQLIMNMILLSLRTGAKSRAALEHDTGVFESQLEPFLTHLTEKHKVVEQDGKYALAPVTSR